MTTTWTFFCGVTPGLETILSQEVAHLLPAAQPHVVNGGVEVRGDEEALWTLAHRSRLAESVRIRLGELMAHNFDQLRQGLLKQPWAAYFPRDSAPTVRATSRKSSLYHTGAIEERAERWIAERLATPGHKQTAHPAGTVHLRLVRDRLTVSIDAIGDLLHRRGYRTHVGRAPLRETLAAACIHLAGNQQPLHGLWDPFCGSGTLPIEFVASTLGHPATTRQDFAFRHWPTHHSQRYESWLANLETAPAETLLAVGSDLDPTAIDAARHNGQQAHCGDGIQWKVGDFDEVSSSVTSGFAIVSNLPYGRRTRGGRKLADLRRRFGALIRRRTDLRPVVVMTTDAHFASATGCPWKVLARISNRGIGVVILALDDV